MIGMNESDWDDLKYYVRRKKITAFIGPELSSHYIGSQKSDQWFPLLKELADEWAEKYPLEKPSHLSRMAQYIAIVGNNELRPKTILASRIESISLPDFSMEKYRKTPYAILADLNLPVYITTNYDHLMEKALEDKGKKPLSAFCRWKEESDLIKKIRRIDTENKPQDSDSPLVFHLYGDINEPNFMVLTERDYVDFAIYMSKEITAALPGPLIESISSNMLLFLGYQLQDINFLVIFQSVIRSIEAASTKKNVGVQFNADLDKVQKKKVEDYLDKYTDKIFNVRVYWGEPDGFCRELHSRLYGP